MRDDTGNIGILFLFVLMVLVMLIFMVWNTGHVSVHRMRAQAAADSAAHASQTVVSRTTNVVTGANMAILRTASAEALSIAAIYTIEESTRNLMDWFEKGTAMMDNPFTFAAGLAIVIQVGREAVILAKFVKETLPAITSLGSYPGRINNLFAFERAAVEATPKIIDQQRRKIERYHGFDIRLAQPTRDGHKGVTPPLKKGSFQTIYVVLRDRVMSDRQGWIPELSKMKLAKAAEAWKRGSATGLGIAALNAGSKHYALSTATLAHELGAPRIGPTDRQRLDHFSVVAVASSPVGKQPPFYGPIYMRPTAGDARTDRRAARGNPAMVAYAQAQTFNPNESMMMGRSPVTPWRVWSREGWEWQPRLSSADGLNDALRADATLRTPFSRGRLRVSPAQELEIVNLH